MSQDVTTGYRITPNTIERAERPVVTRLRRYLHRLIARYIAFFTPAGSRVIEVGPRARLLKDELRGYDVAVFRPASDARFEPREILDTPDAFVRFNAQRIVLNGTLHVEQDIQACLDELHRLCDASARVVIVYYSSLWKPVFRLAHALRVRTKGRDDNWIAPSDLVNLLALSRFQLVTTQSRVLIPIWIPFVSEFVNRWLAPLPVLNWLAVVHIAVARPLKRSWSAAPSVSVIVPARNEAGNIRAAVELLPAMGPDDELIFVEGHSTDDTWAEMNRIAAEFPRRTITCIRQPGHGKGDAVRAGFAVATRDILMIMDADLTVAPEDLPKFYRARTSGICEFVNGTRLVYPMEPRAMNFANMIGNKFFALAFSFLLGQSFKDTLCGTKVIDRAAYRQLAAGREYFGDFDPFGDFDLLFGAQRLGLRIMELPIRYRERTYGTTNIQRWRHGVLLLRMVMFAARKVKFI